MQRLLIILGAVLLVAGLAWPLIRRSGLGRLPGDLFFQGEHFSFYFPLTSSIVVSVVLTVILWLLSR